MWTYEVSTGKMYGPTGILAQGYSGGGVGKNNPAMQAIKDVGPLPSGLYTIEAPVDTEQHGPYVLWLDPNPGNNMFDRSGFGIHGDSIDHPGEASEGCIIMPRFARERIWEGDHTLSVVDSLPVTA